MSRSRTHALVAVLVAGLVLGALSCTRWAPARTSPRLAVQKGPGRVRLVLRGGERLVVRHPVLSGDTLFGVRQVPRLGDTWLRVRVSIPLADIDSIEVRRFDAPATMLVMSAGIALLAVAGNAMEDTGGSSCSGVNVPIFGP